MHAHDEIVVPVRIAAAWPFGIHVACRLGALLLGHINLLLFKSEMPWLALGATAQQTDDANQ